MCMRRLICSGQGGKHEARKLGHNTRIIAGVCHAEDVLDEWRKGQGAKWAP